jgi:hypothetical protein
MYVIKKNIRNIIIFIVIITIFFGVVTSVYYYKNKKWYDFSDSLKNEFHIIKKISIQNYGPHCEIYIYTNKSDMKFLTAEDIFTSFLNSYNQQDFFQYLKKFHENKASGELVYVDVDFIYKNDDYDVMYKFKTYNLNGNRYRFDTWIVSISQEKKYLDKMYYLSDYK